MLSDVKHKMQWIFLNLMRKNCWPSNWRDPSEEKASPLSETGEGWTKDHVAINPTVHQSYRPQLWSWTNDITHPTPILKSKFKHYFNLSKLVFTTPCGNVFYISRMDNMALCFLNVTWNKEWIPMEVMWNWPNKRHNHQSDCSMFKSGSKLPQPLRSLFWWEWHRLPCCKPRQPTQSPERAHKL